MDSSGDELDDLEAMKWSKIGGATMETHDEPDKEKLENGIKETLEFEEALQDLNMKDKLGGRDNFYYFVISTAKYGKHLWKEEIVRYLV